MKTCHILGVPVQTGASRKGCIMGPAALRTAGLPDTLRQLGWDVTDLGDARPDQYQNVNHTNPAVHHLPDMVAWTSSLTRHALQMARTCDVPVFMGGDHSMSAGTVAGIAQHAAELNQPQFVLWLDAHTDLHTLHTTTSGNLHGTPVAYFTGQTGFEGLPPLAAPVDPHNMYMMGIRSVDPEEKRHARDIGVTVFDMRTLDESGVIRPLTHFLERVEHAGGRLHVSLDVDFLDPEIAPGGGTVVPGGITFREAHLIMEILHDSGLVTSLDLAELNPFLDVRGKTAHLLTDLTASLFGRHIL
ncbi:arginase [Acetobacter thailandicus]|uniref:Arginase n=1 Tax=Acetobacter thailandicus TaxID=1502842 RepID=A0ABT3QCG5_9PROT|nr:arginase [Acetobacter thailandicus]MCX2562919.1 arginase [Acetobacter thailandicus]NHN95677.1 arginase [Acetobacter thailandicus]